MTRQGLPRLMSEFELTLPAARVEAFFNAVGWAQPRRPSMPPTLATCFRHGEFEAFQKLGVPLPTVLHGEQSYTLLRDIEADKPYRGATSLIQSYERAGKEGMVMKFYVLQTDLFDATTGEKCVE